MLECSHDVRSLRASYNNRFLIAFSDQTRDLSIISKRGNIIGISELPVPIQSAAIDDYAAVLYFQTNPGYSYLRTFETNQDTGLPSYTDCLLASKDKIWGVRPCESGSIVERLEKGLLSWSKNKSLTIEDPSMQLGGILLKTFRSDSIAVVGFEYQESLDEVCYSLYYIDGTETGNESTARRLDVFNRYLPIFAPHGTEMIGLGRSGIIRSIYPYNEAMLHRDWPESSPYDSVNFSSCYIDDVRVLILLNHCQLVTLHTRSLELEATFSIKGFDLAFEDSSPALVLTFVRLGNQIVFLIQQDSNLTPKIVMVDIASFTNALI